MLPNWIKEWRSGDISMPLSRQSFSAAEGLAMEHKRPGFKVFFTSIGS
jgi:hypothetical protein